MGNLTRMVPKIGMASKEFLQDFLEKWGDELNGVIVIARHKDGDAVDGWSREFIEDPVAALGITEQFKLDFWDALFQKRKEIAGGQ